MLLNIHSITSAKRDVNKILRYCAFVFCHFSFVGMILLLLIFSYFDKQKTKRNILGENKRNKQKDDKKNENDKTSRLTCVSIDWCVALCRKVRWGLEPSTNELHRVGQIWEQKSTRNVENKHFQLWSYSMIVENI